MSNALQIFNDLPTAPEGYEVPTPTFLNAYWHNGSQQLKQIGGVPYFGGWCISADDVSERLPDEWKLLQMTARNGTDYSVWATEVINVAVLQSRSFWVTRQTDSNDKPEYYRTFAEGLTQKAELLGIVRGISSPVVIGAKGFNAKNLLEAYSKGYNTVKRAAQKNIAPYSVYLPLRGATKNGAPDFSMVGKKEKSPIVRIVFASTSIDATWRVPDSIIAECNSSLEIARQWREAKFIEQISGEQVDLETGEIVE